MCVVGKRNKKCWFFEHLTALEGKTLSLNFAGHSIYKDMEPVYLLKKGLVIEKNIGILHRFNADLYGNFLDIILANY